VLEAIGLPIFQHAALAGAFLGAMASVVGVYVLLRRIVFLAIALAQVASAAVALALLAGWEPLPAALVASLAASVGLARLQSGDRMPVEAVLGTMYAVAAAAGIAFVALNPVGEARALTALFGTLLSVPRSELVALVGVAVLVLAIHVLFRRPFVFVSFDRDAAIAQGLPVRRWELLLHVTLGIAIAFAIRSAGVLVTFALLVIPALAGRAVGDRLETMLATAVALGTVSVPIGLALAFAVDLPPSAAVPLAAAALGGLLIVVVRGARSARAALAVLLVALPSSAGADDAIDRQIEALREEVRELRRIVGEQQRVIETLTGQARQSPAPMAPGVSAGAPHPSAPPGGPATGAPAPTGVSATGAPAGPGAATAGAPGPAPGPLPPWIALLPEVRVEGNLIGNYTFGRKRRTLERQLGEEVEGEEFFVRRDRLNIREVEVGLRSSIDPFARFEAILSAEQRFDGDLDVGLEEGILTFGALPWRLEAKLGKFRTGFGEFNDSDPEEFPAVDPPNVIRHLFGVDGWIDTGLAVTRRFGLTDTASVMLWGAVFNGDNEQAFHGGGAGMARRPAWFVRGESFLELGDVTGFEVGLGYAQGRTRDETGRATLASRIVNAHVELDHRGPVLLFPLGVNTLVEGFYSLRDRKVENPDEGVDRRETLGRLGFYALVEGQLTRRWSLGARFDHAELPEREDTGPSIRRETAGSVIVSFRPSRFLTLRGQYTRTARNFAVDSDEIYLQALFTLGYERPGPF
jgi:zinc transport system permease protein